MTRQRRVRRGHGHRRTITIENTPVTIVGVLARGFRGVDLSQAPDLYLPVNTIADVGRSTTNYFAEANTGYSPTAGWTIIGRLHPGASAPARADRGAS